MKLVVSALVILSPFVVLAQCPLTQVPSGCTSDLTTCIQVACTLDCTVQQQSNCVCDRLNKMIDCYNANCSSGSGAVSAVQSLQSQVTNQCAGTSLSAVNSSGSSGAGGTSATGVSGVVTPTPISGPQPSSSSGTFSATYSIASANSPLTSATASSDTGSATSSRLSTSISVTSSSSGAQRVVTGSLVAMCAVAVASLLVI